MSAALAFTGSLFPETTTQTEPLPPIAVHPAPQLGPLTLKEELARERARFEELSAVWNELFRQQWDAAKAVRTCGARIMVLERIENPDPIPDYGIMHGAR